MRWWFLPGKGRPSCPSLGKNDISSGRALDEWSKLRLGRWAKKKPSFADEKGFFCKRSILGQDFGEIYRQQKIFAFRAAIHP